MTEWKLNNGESPYLSQSDIHDSALLGKHIGPHTPTPTLSMYDLSSNNTDSNWNFDHQRRNKQRYSNFITPTAAFETSTRSDLNGQEHLPNNKQLWVSRNEKSNDNNNNKSFGLATSLSSSSPTNTNHHHHHTLLDSFTTLSSNPLQYQQQQHQHHRIFHNNNQNNNDSNNNDILMNHHHEIKNISSNNSNSHYHSHVNNHQQLNDNKESIDYKYPTNQHHHYHHHNNRSYSMDTHPLLPYHSHHSIQHRHNSIATVQQAAAQAAVAMSYQPHSSHSSQVWYPHTNAYQKNVHAPFDQISSTTSNTALFKRDNVFHHETQTYEANLTSEQNFNPVISPSRLNHIDYNISTTTANPLSFISKNHHNSLEENNDEKEEMKSRLNENNNNLINETNKSDNELKKGKKNMNSKQQTGKRRSPNGFFVFCSARRHILKEGKTNVRNTDINRQLGDEWKALTNDERDWYKREADKIRTELSKADNETLQHPVETQPFALKHHENSLSLTIAADDDDDDDDREGESESETLHSNNKNDNYNDNDNDDLSRRTSIGSALLSSGNSSLCSLSTPSQQNHSSFDSNTNNDNTTSSSVLNLASISGAAEADALDQAAAVAISSSATNNSPPFNNSDDHYQLNSEKKRLKRPPNSYLLFNKEMRRKLLNQDEKLSVAEKSKIISESWKTLPQERKDFYIKEAANLKRKHLEDHPDYIYSRRSREELKKAGHRFKPSKKKEKYGDNDNEYRSSSVTAMNVSIYDHESYLDEDINGDPMMVQQEESRRRKKKSENESRGRKKKKLTYPHAPKHPMSGFLFFAAYVRPEITLQCVNKRVGDISKAISARWKQLTDDEKLPWLEKAKDDKARYAREMEEFNILQKKEKEQQQRDRNRLIDINNDNSDEEQFYNNDHNNVNNKKSSISSTSSSLSSSSSILTNSSDIIDQHISSSSPSLKVTQTNHLGMINDNHQHHHHHHLKMITNKNRPYQHHHSHLQERFKSYSRIHSVLATSRPASPTELDQMDIARVAQMVNPTGNRPPLLSTTAPSNIQHDHPIGNVPLHLPILD
ncbi:unnamed protein product [Cunninghamella blakesleeana]